MASDTVIFDRSRSRLYGINHETPTFWDSLSANEQQASVDFSAEGSKSIFSPIPERSMRLFILRPGLVDEPIQGTLVVSEPDVGEYDFLSFSWESKSMSQPIIVNGKDFFIPASLKDSLKCLRYRDRTRTFWIDAICINMDDPFERSQAHSLWPLIISGAAHVRIWLGAEDEHSELAFDQIQVTFDNFDKIFENPDVAERLVAFKSLMKRPWFSRRWVIQEIAYAREASIYCGPFQASWTDFSSLVTLLASMWNDSGPIGDINHLFATRLVLFCGRQFRKSESGAPMVPLLPLESAVCLLADFKCTNPRDTIYALVSLASKTGWSAFSRLESLTRRKLSVKPSASMPIRVSDSEKEQSIASEAFVVSYNKPFIEVAMDFVRFVIDTSKSIDIICRAWAPTSEADYLPSWIRSLQHAEYSTNSNGDSSRLNAEPLTSLKGLMIPRYNAGGNLREQPTLQHNNLIVNGFMIGSVSRLAMPALSGNVPMEWAELGGWNGSQDAVPEQLWRTLVADRDLSGQHAPLWYSLACKYGLQQSIEGGDMNIGELASRSQPARFSEFYRRVQKVVWSRKLMKTSSGNLGLAPRKGQPGDLICIFYGCSVPVILRLQTSSEGIVYELIGESFVLGMMDGEALELDLPDQNFVLV